MQPADDQPAVTRVRPAAGFLLNVNFVFISTVVGYFLAFFYLVALARALGPEGRGLMALFQTGVNLGFAFLGLGIASSVLYFVSRNDHTPRDSLECGLVVTLGATAATALLVFVVVPLFGDALRADEMPYASALIAVPALIQSHVVAGVLRSHNRFLALSIVNTMQPLSVVVGLIAVDVFSTLTIERAIYLWSLALLPAVVIGYALIGVKSWPRRLPTLSTLIPPVRFGIQSQLGNLVQLLNYRLDTYIVLFFVNTSGVGLYAVGVSLSEGMWFIANSVAVVLLTNLTAGDDDNAARMTPVICRNTLLVTALAAIPAAIVSPVFIPAVFGSEFDAAVVPFLLLLPGTIAQAGTKILATYVFSRGRPIVNAQISLIMLVLGLGLDVVLIPLVGVAGASIASTIAYGAGLAMTVVAYRRMSGLPIADVLLPKREDVSLYRNAFVAALGRLGIKRPNQPRAVGSDS